MAIPGSNLLRKALTVIKPQEVVYFRYIGRSTTGAGIYESGFAPGKKRKGSVQPVPRELYERFGLDMQKNYVKFFQPRDAEDIGRNTSGDQFVFDGNRYQIESNVPWFGVDGWTQSLSVQI